MMDFLHSLNRQMHFRTIMHLGLFVKTQQLPDIYSVVNLCFVRDDTNPQTLVSDTMTIRKLTSLHTGDGAEHIPGCALHGEMPTPQTQHETWRRSQYASQ